MARLDKAVAAIEPKAMGLVRAHASKWRLKAQLAFWRIAHRLSRLWIEERSAGQFAVKAQVNPIKDVVNKVFTPEKLHDMLMKVGSSLNNHPAIKGQLAQIRADRLANKGKPPKPGTDDPENPRQAQSPVAEALAMQKGFDPRKPLQVEHVAMGDQTVKQRQMFHDGPNSSIVHGIGEGGHYDPGVVNALKGMEKDGLSPAVLRQGLHNLLQNKPIGPEFAKHPEHASKLAAVTRLFVVEGARTPNAFATGFMAWETAGHPGTSLEDVVTTLNPVAPKHAQEHHRDALRPPETLAESQRQNVDAIFQAELAATVRYLEVLMRAEKPMFTNDAECEVFVRDKLEQHLKMKLEALLL